MQISQAQALNYKCIEGLSYMLFSLIQYRCVRGQLEICLLQTASRGLLMIKNKNFSRQIEATVCLKQWVCSSTCQTLACHFLMCHFGDLAKILVPKFWQGILATKWHAIFNVPFWTLRKNFGAKILARYFNVPFC